MKNIYEDCPVFTGEQIKLELVADSDASALLNCYNDSLAVPFFNSDNCDGDDFHYTTLKRMSEAIGFWLYAYKNSAFVRMTVKNLLTGEVFGTIEIFHRESDDYFNDCGLLRIDLKSSAETESIISDILQVASREFYTIFNTDRLVTKAIPAATERIKALRKAGYTLSSHKLLEKFDDYWEVRK